jgi:hypothetical protein
MRSKHSTAISLFSALLPPAAFLARTNAMLPPETSPPRRSAPAPHQSESRPHRRTFSGVLACIRIERKNVTMPSPKLVIVKVVRIHASVVRSSDKLVRNNASSVRSSLSVTRSSPFSWSFIASGLSPCRTAYSSANIWSNTIALLTPQQQGPPPVLPYVQR